MTNPQQSPGGLPIAAIVPLAIAGIVILAWAGWSRREPVLIARTQARLA